MSFIRILSSKIPTDVAKYIYWEFSGIPISRQEARTNYGNVLCQLRYKFVLIDLKKMFNGVGN